MKIKTITCQHVYNYGASLQAYALQHYLESMGHEVEIIDFNPWFHCNRYNPFWKPRIGKIAKLIRLLPFMGYIILPLKAYRSGMFKTWGRKIAFDKFEKEYYHLTPIKYHSSEELRQNPPKADIYVAGSDQIWNTLSENGKEPGYYLDFGDEDVKRISYAASLATSKISDGWSNFVRDKISRLDAVSVREKMGAELLKKLEINNVSVVLDPVFLLDKDEWGKLADKGHKYSLQPNSYILLYDFLGNDEKMKCFVKNYAIKHQLQIVSVNDFREHEYAQVNINDAGPLEFLNLIRNAACVIANSFHATAFSVIFEKEFYTFNLVGHNNSSRMHDFLSEIDLLERMDPSGASYHQIKWNNIEVALNRKKKDGYSYISGALKG